jgi:DNA-binding NtrC family response regulator
MVSAVLIVDDDARMREVLSRWLSAAGYETREAADAETALPLLTAGGCDVALCDVTMPGKGGLWLVERAREECPDVAIVLATGLQNVHPSISLGGNVVDYLIKPFERATVLTAVGLARAWHDSPKANPAAGGGDQLTAWLQGRTQASGAGS